MDELAEKLRGGLGDHRLRSHLVRLGRSEPRRGPIPTAEDLGGAGILIQTQSGSKGVLTAAHCLTGMFAVNEAHWIDQCVAVICPKTPNSQDVAWTHTHLADAKIEEGGSGDDVPDIAWLPLAAAESSLLERNGGVFLQFGRIVAPRRSSVGEKGVAGVEFQAVHGWRAEYERSFPGGTNVMVNTRLLHKQPPAHVKRRRSVLREHIGALFPGFRCCSWRGPICRLGESCARHIG